MKKLNCILLVDDNPADNRYHQIIIEEMNIAEKIEFAANGLEAIDYLNDDSKTLPDLIFLDINMPRMNGWEFLEAYKNIAPEKKAQAVVVMFSTSSNPDDIKRAEENEDVATFETKPLTIETIEEILNTYFK
jgi:CheY-like chemotaxis protein